MKIWILTHEHNDYNQYGEYFLKCYKEKPTKEQINSEIEVWHTFEREDYVEHVLNGGGRKGVEDIWYYLKEVEAE